MLLYHGFVFVTGVLGKDTADDDALASEFVGALDAFVHHDLHLQTCLLEACHEGAALLIGKEAKDALSYLLAYLVDGDELVEGGTFQAIHRAEGAGKFLGYGLTHEANADGEEYALKGDLTRAFDAAHDILSRLLAHALETTDMGDAQVVEIGSIVYQAYRIEEVYGLGSKTVDIHCFA